MIGRRPANNGAEASKWQNIGTKCAPPIVVLPVSVFCFEIEAMLTSAGFDPFCPERRQKALSYIYTPSASLLALSKMASNLSAVICGFAT
jgi:hypothetical protein